MIDSPLTRNRRHVQTGWLALVVAVGSLIPSSGGYAEEAWEYSSYQVDVVVVAAPGSGLSDATEANLRRAIKWYSGIKDLAVWDVQTRSVPSPLRYELASSFESPNIDLIAGLDLVAIAKKDKHPNLKLKKVAYFMSGRPFVKSGLRKKGKDDELRVGICNPRQSIVGRRSYRLLQRHWLTDSKSSESGMLDTVSTVADSPSKLIAQVMGDELDVAIVRKQDLSEQQEGLDIVPVEEVTRKDKLFLVIADASDGQYRIRAREFDCRGQLWGPIEERLTNQIEGLPQLAYEAVEFTFAPVVRIEEVSLDGKTTMTRLRAGGLIDRELSPNSPARLDVGSVMRPVIRRNDRLGNVLENGIEVLEWSYLEVVSQDGVRFGCDIYSAYRNPVGGRSSRRVERTALLVRPRGSSTELKLATNDDPPETLPNYQIYEKDKEGNSVFLGRTDWRGSFEIGQSEDPIRVVYVKNGQNVLARLPIVPGLFPVETAYTYDDSHRLWAEGRIRSLRASFLDLVARRQVLAKRIRTELAKGEYQLARQLTQQLSELPTRSDFRLDIEDVAHDVESKNPRVQAKIDILMNDVRRILPNFLDPQLAPSLEREVENARKNPSSVEPEE